MDRRPYVPAACAALGLLGILALALVLHDGVTFAYDDSGNSCKTLTADSADDLSSALLPVRVLLVAWVLATGLGLTAAAGRLTARGRPVVLGAGVVVSAALAIAVPGFVGVDLLGGFLLVPLWFVLACVVVPVSRLAVRQRGEPVGDWLLVSVGWLLVTGGVLPLVLLLLTGSGEIRSC